MAWADAYLRTKWHLDPFSRLATIYTNVTDRQDRQNGHPKTTQYTINDNDVGSVLLCSGELLGLKSGVNTFDNRRSRTVEGHEGRERVEDNPPKNEVSSRNGLL